ncbi:MAG: TM2 domain-containing protein [Paludibacteraceae bacterium]|nr:TM2 domain-containing protein [Paludibacteraceae bacterium]
MKDKTLAGLLAIFCGTIGLHKFYLSKYLMGVIYIIFSWTLIPTLLGIIEGIRYLMMTDAEFEDKYIITKESPIIEKKNVSNNTAKSDIAKSNENERTDSIENKYPDAQFILKGVAGQLYVFENRVIMERKGVLGTLVHGFAGSKTIPFKSLYSIQFRDATSLTNGYIQFGIIGGNERQGGFFQAADDENSIFFTKEYSDVTSQIKNYIESHIY